MNNSRREISNLPMPSWPRSGWLFTALILLATIGFAGCEPTAPEFSETADTTVVRPPTMTVLVIGDEQFGDVVSRQWAARQDGDLTIVKKTAKELAEGDYQLGSGVDIVIYPPGMLGELVSRNEILELPKWLWESDELNRKELLRHHRLSLIRHGDASWAVPLGAPQLTLMYNIDTFDALNLLPPKDWDQFLELSAKLQKAADLSRKDSESKNGKKLPNQVELPFARGWAAQVFLRGPPR